MSTRRLTSAVLFALVVGLVTAASWPSPARSAIGLTSVDLDVPAEVHVDPSACGISGTVTMGSVAARTDGTRTIGTCVVTFGSVNGSGVQLQARDQRIIPGATNGTAVIPWTGAPGTSTLPEGTIGFAMTNLSAGATSPLNLNDWNDLPSAASAYANLAKMTSFGSDETIDLDLAVNPALSTEPGSYDVQIDLQVIAP